jgi:hypothetical protein
MPEEDLPPPPEEEGAQLPAPPEPSQEAEPAQETPPVQEPDEEEDEWTFPKKPYPLQRGRAAQPASKQQAAPAPSLERYDLGEEPAAPAAPVPIPLDGYDPIGLAPLPRTKDTEEVAGDKPSPPKTEVSRFEERLALRRQEVPPPKWPMWTGVYTFPWYARTFWPWLGLSFGGMIMALLMRVALICYPF